MENKTKSAAMGALLWTGENQREMFDFLTNGEKTDDYMSAAGENFYIDHSKVRGGLVIRTLDGDKIAKIGDFVVKDTDGNFQPCNVFNQTSDIYTEPNDARGSAYGPVEVFQSQEELNECLKWWQHRLYLDGWMIRAAVVDEIEDCENDDAVGRNTFNFEVSQSYIQILSEGSFEQKNPFCEHICMEKTLVHELLHCIYGWLDNGESYEGMYLMAKEHQQIEQMAKSLIMAKYNLDYDYFEKVQE